ncbi:MAG: uracil-DNA glycosylase [Bacteroidia bacterium]|jgi:uracil-DNA glycosylase
MSNIPGQLEASWLNALEEEFDKSYFKDLNTFLSDSKQSGKIIYPDDSKIFAALDACPFDKVRIVIIGQDPYHGTNQANGLCFSVSPGMKVPPSLVNIYREINADLGLPIPAHGDLSYLAEQGVLLLNATLTVEAHNAGSHQNKGWETFTDSVIESLNDKCENIVFLLWGGYAKRKGKKIDRSKHLVLESGHPSPLSANMGHWFGNKHFSNCNAYLIENGFMPMDWRVG